MTALILGKPKMSSSWIVNFYPTPALGFDPLSRQYPRNRADDENAAIDLVLIEFPRAKIIDVRLRTLTVWIPEP